MIVDTKLYLFSCAHKVISLTTLALNVHLMETKQINVLAIKPTRNNSSIAF